VRHGDDHILRVDVFVSNPGGCVENALKIECEGKFGSDEEEKNDGIRLHLELKTTIESFRNEAEAQDCKSKAVKLLYSRNCLEFV
jgi:hypothetical protein